MESTAGRLILRWVGPLVARPVFYLQLAGVAGAYLAAGKFGINLSVAHGVITPVWAPSGIALAALLVLGPRVWPAVLLGAFLANVTSGAGVLVSAGIAVGNTLEPVVGAYLLRRVDFRVSLERVRDVLSFVVLGGLVSTLVSATNGVTILTLTHQSGGSYGSEWVLWWFGDAVGDLMVAPLLLVAFAHRTQRLDRKRLLEFAALLSALCAASAVVFLAGAWRYPYMIFPLLLWAALRFRQIGAATNSLVVGAIGTWGTVAGTVPIASTSPTERVQIIQALVGVLAVSLLVMGATLSEREASTRELEQTAVSLSEAQALTHIGSWEWDMARDRVTWSDELYRIYGFAPQSVAVTYGFFVERLHPADRPFVESTVTAAFEERRPFSFEHRILLPDGGERLVHGRGRVIVDAGGEPVRMVGTAQDITERKQAESLRDDILATVSHELRTPLTSVLGFALTLQQRRSQLGDTADAVVSQIVEQAWRLERLLSDLLDVERLRRGLVAPVRRPTDLAALVERVVEGHRSPDHAIRVDAELVVANVDDAKVERIVENLLGNAVRHTPAGTAISVQVARDDRDLLIVVEDDGPGIPDRLKEQVFEIFNRGGKVLSSERGTGIGLSLVARFAALHGGRAWVEDGGAGGASFRVLLPDCVHSPKSA